MPSILAQLARDQLFLADSIDIIKQQQITKVKDRLDDRTALISVEEVLRDVFDKPNKKVKKRDFIQLIQTVSSSMTPQDLEKVSKLITETEGDEISTGDVRSALGSPILGKPEEGSTIGYMPTLEPSTAGAAAAAAAGSMSEEEIDRKTDKVLMSFRKIKGNVRGADADVVRQLNRLNTPELKEAFRAKLNPSDYTAKFKSNPLQQAGILK